MGEKSDEEKLHRARLHELAGLQRFCLSELQDNVEPGHQRCKEHPDDLHEAPDDNAGVVLAESAAPAGPSSSRRPSGHAVLRASKR